MSAVKAWRVIITTSLVHSFWAMKSFIPESHGKQRTLTKTHGSRNDRAKPAELEPPFHDA